jgi:hypothetical protein
MKFAGNSERHRAFKLFFVPLLMVSLVTQLTVVWTQLSDIRDGYFDFVLYYSAARILRDGNGSRLYDLEVQRAYQKEFAAPNDRDLPFNHLPYELLPLTFLAGFSFPTAHVLWTAVNIALFAILLLRILPLIHAQQRGLVVLMTAAYFPSITALKMGQDSIISTLLLAEAFVSLKHGREAIAGAVLAAGLYKPQLFLPLFGILLLRRRWPAVGAFFGVALVLGVISLAMVGWSGLRGLVDLWLPMINRGNVVWPELMVNLRGLVFVTFDLFGLPQQTNTVVLAVSLFLYIVALRSWPCHEKKTEELLDLRFAFAIVITALISFHLYSYDSTILILPLAIMLNRVLKEADRYSINQRVFIAILIAWFVPLLPNLLLSAAIFAWWALPLAIFCAVLFVEISRCSKAAPGSA